MTSYNFKVIIVACWNFNNSHKDVWPGLQFKQLSNFDARLLESKYVLYGKACPTD